MGKQVKYSATPKADIYHMPEGESKIELLEGEWIFDPSRTHGAKVYGPAKLTVYNYPSHIEVIID